MDVLFKFMITETASAAAASSTSTQPPTGDSAKPRSRSVQSQKVANAITAGAQMIEKALTNPAIVALLAPRGYDEAELKAGLVLCQAAQKAFNLRQNSLGSVSEAKKARDAAWETARDEFVEYRSTVQAKYEDAPTRRALGAAGKVSRDLQKFVTQATAAYEAGQQPPFAGPLAKRSFTPARMAAALAGLETLTKLDNDFAAAGGESGGFVEDRDGAMAKMRTWLREFRANAILALKKNPGYRAGLGL